MQHSEAKTSLGKASDLPLVRLPRGRNKTADSPKKKRTAFDDLVKKIDREENKRGGHRGPPASPRFSQKKARPRKAFTLGLKRALYTKKRKKDGLQEAPPGDCGKRRSQNKEGGEMSKSYGNKGIPDHGEKGTI